MSMKRCDNGHFYDDNENLNCPYCGIGATTPKTTRKKEPPRTENMHNPFAPVAPGASQGQGAEFVGNAGSDPMTIRVMKEKTGVDPVVGWLVCIKGPEMGRSYIIRTARNFIGRSDENQITIKDPAVSRKKHAVISFNPELAQFKIAAGDSTGLVYLGKDTVEEAKLMEGGDIIRLGESHLMLVPFCGQYHNWVEMDSDG